MIDDYAEKGLLSGFFQFGSTLFLEVGDLINEQTFHDSSHSLIFSCQKHILSNGDHDNISYAQIMSAAKSLSLDEIINDSDLKTYIKNLLNPSSSIEASKQFAVKLRKLQVARELSIKCDEINKELKNVTGDESIEDILACAESPILDYSTSLASSTENDIEDLFRGVDEFLQSKKNNPVTQIGIPTGFSFYDECLGGGLREATVNMLGARAKQGKSIFAMNLGLNLILNNIHVLYLDTELLREEQMARGLACHNETNIRDIECGNISDRILESTSSINQKYYKYANIAGVPFERIVSVMKKWLTKYVKFDDHGKLNPCVVIYDYLKVMDKKDVSEHIKEYQSLGFMMTALHNLTRRYKFPAFVLTQLNRDGINTEDIAVVAGSDRIAWYCSNFSILKEKTPEELADENHEFGNYKLKCIIARHGSGHPDKDWINLEVIKSRAKIKELGLRSMSILSKKDNEVKF